MQSFTATRHDVPTVCWRPSVMTVYVQLEVWQHWLMLAGICGGIMKSTRGKEALRVDPVSRGSVVWSHPVTLPLCNTAATWDFYFHLFSLFAQSELPLHSGYQKSSFTKKPCRIDKITTYMEQTLGFSSHLRHQGHVLGTVSGNPENNLHISVFKACSWYHYLKVLIGFWLRKHTVHTRDPNKHPF